MTIHSEHPFAPDDAGRSPVRRFRGRLASPVTLWTSSHRGERAGLTVSSMLVADGDPGYLVGVLDPTSDLVTALSASGAAVVALLDGRHLSLADGFGYVAPAPGGPFAAAGWRDTQWGPVLDGAGAWAAGRLDGDLTALGWGVQARLLIEHVELGEDQGSLVHRRGRYRSG